MWYSPDRLNLAPGPVTVPDFVLEAIAKPVIHHRSDEFRALFGELQTGAQYFFQSSGFVACLSGTGTHGMEIAIRSLLKPAHRVLVVSYGKFSERWKLYADQLGCDTHVLSAPPGRRPAVAELQALLEQSDDFHAAVLTHCETSTGAVLDLETFAGMIREHSPACLILSDEITGAGIIPFYQDVWGIDVAVAASQKSLMNPAGTVYVSLSQRVTAMMEQGPAEDAFHLAPYVRSGMKNEYPFTAPTQLFYGVRAAFRHIAGESLPVIWNRTHGMAAEFRRRIQAMGAVLFADPPADSLTAFSFEGLELGEMFRKMKDEKKIEMAEGQGELTGKLLRVAHFGSVGMSEMQRCLVALQEVKGEMEK